MPAKKGMRRIKKAKSFKKMGKKGFEVAGG
jgi:hypothetical protein